MRDYSPVPYLSRKPTTPKAKVEGCSGGRGVMDDKRLGEILGYQNDTQIYTIPGYHWL